MGVGTLTGKVPGLVIPLVLALALGPALAVPARAQGAGEKATGELATDETAMDEAMPGGAPSGMIRGFLLQDDQATRIPGATVTAIDIRTGTRYPSNITGDNGAYEILNLPPGTYDLGIEVAGAVYVTDSLVEVAEGQRVTLSFALQPKKPNRKVAGIDQPPEGTASALTFQGPGIDLTAAGGKSFASSPGGITLWSIIGAGVLYAVFSNNDEDVSPSTP